MTAIKIEKNVPIPKSTAGRRKQARYPFAEMSVGDSFLVRCKEERDVQRIRGVVQAYSVRTGWKFKTRSVEGGIRVWLVSLDTSIQKMARAA
jgi:hypothetical protein